MIVWGGGTATGNVADGGIYDPGSNTGTPLGAPSGFVARAEHTAIWTGTEMIIWGGEAAGGNRADGAAFTPKAPALACCRQARRLGCALRQADVSQTGQLYVLK